MRTSDFDADAMLIAIAVTSLIGLVLLFAMGVEPPGSDYRCPNCRRVLHVAR